MTDRIPKTPDFSWHDSLIHAIRFRTPEPASGIWHSDLVLDIDYIVEWLCGPADSGRFRVAPATLVFHDVTDLRLTIDFGDSGFGQAINLPSIAAIWKEPAVAKNAIEPIEYYRWRIELNLPKDGEIVFGASGYEQQFRAEPKLVDEPWLSAESRATAGID